MVCLVGCSAEPGADVQPWLEPITPYDPLQWVDPLIGTGGQAAQVTGVSPGASMPFGLTLVGPDTRHSAYGALGAYHFGGYHFDDDQVDGFSHTHSHGMGVNDYGAVLVMPRARWDPAWTTDVGRSVSFDHGTEQATAGRYAVTLEDATRVEIVATVRGAHHRYVFDGLDAPVVVLDLGHTLGDMSVAEASLHLDPITGELLGFQRLMGGYSGRFGGLQTWFSGVVDPAPIAVGAWSDPDVPLAGEVDATGPTAGGWLQFPVGTTEVHLRLAVSYVDAEGALANRLAELPDLDLGQRLVEAETAWTDALSGVRVRSEDTGLMRTFHTAQYHARLMPSRIDDVDGRYRSVEDTIRTTTSPYYSDFSMWDTFRTLHPWLVLTEPERQAELLGALVQMTDDGGSVPRWPLAHGYTSGMVGTPADQIFAGSFLKGVDVPAVDRMFDACFAHATGPQEHAGRAGIAGYVERGWVASEDAGAAASRTLEFAWSDHALARWADALGRTEEAVVLWAQAGNWANTWSPEAGRFLARSETGSFGEVPDAFAWAPDYTEGNSWHYAWGAPHDVPGMIALRHGGDADAYLAELYDYWEEVYAEPDDAFPDDWYWHGNEPVMHHAALGSLAGDQGLSAEAARWVLDHRYDDTPQGLDGNDDAGTLSAWFLFASIGLYPVAGTPDYAVLAPLFERVEVDRPDGEWVLMAPGASERARYVSRISLADGDTTETVLTHDQLLAGPATFWMTSIRPAAAP
jgi:predicted alpha-1,2-mannosidase